VKIGEKYSALYMNKWAEVLPVTSNQNKNTLFQPNSINLQGESRGYEQHDFFFSTTILKRRHCCVSLVKLLMEVCNTK
jgi:hypothetical protein